MVDGAIVAMIEKKRTSDTVRCITCGAVPKAAGPADFVTSHIEANPTHRVRYISVATSIIVYSRSIGGLARGSR